jgi:predicted DNA binding protein
MVHPGVRVFIMNTQLEGNMQRAFSVIYSKKDGEVSAAIRTLEKYPGLKCMNVMGIQGNLASLTYKFPQTSAFSTVNVMGFRMHPVVVKGGVEKWFFVSSREDIQSSVKQRLNEDKTKLISMKRLSTDEFMKEYSRILTEFWSINVLHSSGESDGSLLEEAMEAGYFEWPRKLSLSELSDKLKIPRTTLTYRLRKVEKSIFQTLNTDDK